MMLYFTYNIISCHIFSCTEIFANSDLADIFTGG